MCKYCDGSGHELNLDTEDYSVYITNKRYLAMECYAGFLGTFRGSCEIKYCPMCGRKLIEE